ncbi:hypothetical protein PAECIP111892_05283 [Paenibacillus auburnensis]|uniref:DUF3048 domain-containing protein n=1 Tax=Paenibacillus auburnensis TaxID=2905649 RepID=A0ABM9CSR2_9BACL|nr:DUF3048 domain-containing protein [Paenibacillus auburnensis]CAH1223124.1 hypothetical protein PAECIP111892_05283 [Paenibacillus auburnensis]
MPLNRYPSRMISVILLAALMLSACGSEKPAPEAAPTAMPTLSPLPSTIPEPSPTAEPAAQQVSGLTGLPVQEGSLPRPLAVMINNAPAARPQSGVSEADILYEVLAEGGITRIIGIFQSHTGVVKIGPIRSIRPYLIDIGESYGGVTVHAGGSPAAYAILQRQKKEDMDEIGKAGAYFWRDKERKAPHNLYSNAAKLREGAAKLGYAGSVAVPGYQFTDPDFLPTEGEAAAELNVNFLLKSYTVGYKYDAQRRTYLRSVNGKPHLDLNNNNPVEAANVMVIGADHKVLDDVGRLQIDVELGGEALLFQRGTVLKGKWARNPGDIIRFVKADGTEALMYPGVTHILIVPNSPSFSSHVEYPVSPSRD